MHDVSGCAFIATQNIHLAIAHVGDLLVGIADRIDKLTSFQFFKHKLKQLRIILVVRLQKPTLGMFSLIVDANKKKQWNIRHSNV
jgi:hypothetical protein